MTPSGTDGSFGNWALDVPIEGSFSLATDFKIIVAKNQFLKMPSAFMNIRTDDPLLKDQNFYPNAIT